MANAFGRRIMRRFVINEISGVDRGAVEGATVRIMKRHDSSSATPMSDRLAALVDNHRRGYPHLTFEQRYAFAWNMLSLKDRNQIRAEESGEWQKLQAEEARRRASAMRKGMNVDIHALAMTALECAAVAIRKNNPCLSEAQSFARAMTAHPDIAKIERESARSALAATTIGDAPVTPRTDVAHANESVAKRDHALGELRKLADEIRRDEPRLSQEGAFVKAMKIRPDLAKAERLASRQALYAI
jgi:hypothetical protein